MSRIAGFNLGKAIRATLGSLEKRVIGALMLIVLCTVSLQFISQDRAFKLHSESQALSDAAGDVEHADQLVRAVSQFRLATRLYLSPGDSRDAVRAGDELTDAAMQIGTQVTALRLSGVDFYDLPGGDVAFEDMDRHIVRIIEAGRGATAPFAVRDLVESRNAQMAKLAGEIHTQAAAARDEATMKISRSTRNWEMLVTVAGLVTVAVVSVILLDLMRNIMPALRRMHAALRRLADGDLDFEIEKFELRELQALSGSLETFRRNALAVKNLAFTDPSTGMPNRRAFVEQVASRLAREVGPGAQGCVVMLADVDRFKHVNDDYGHAAGDKLVKLIGERMVDELGEGAMVARVGGDEFAIFAPLAEGRSAAALGSKLVSAVRAPFDLGNFTVVVTVSIGLAKCACDQVDCDVNVLLNRADLAVYAAKRNGRNCATCFTSELEEERELDRALERDLAWAFAEGQLRMVYQPIHPVANADGEVEALVRWRHPRLGDISPARFIPAAERSGLMVELGGWIIERALADLTRWPALSMSINLSPLQLQQDGFVGFLMDCCRKNGIDPHRLTLEVTESLSIERNTRALLTLELLRNSGFRIALDDFGTGYSSLCMMKSFRFDRLKLDRSLISDLGKDPTSQAVFDAAVTMALSIGAEVVAEGISEENLVEPIRSAGCTHLQGFLYSRPIEADSVEEYYLGKAALKSKVA
ncbi:MAG: EAL domain-containing protein [Novosphingobium sp.]|nr:EAL domain-containing protein [Novosphingobium sp.]